MSAYSDKSSSFPKVTIPFLTFRVAIGLHWAACLRLGRVHRLPCALILAPSGPMASVSFPDVHFLAFIFSNLNLQVLLFTSTTSTSSLDLLLLNFGNLQSKLTFLWSVFFICSTEKYLKNTNAAACFQVTCRTYCPSLAVFDHN